MRQVGISRRQPVRLGRFGCPSPCRRSAGAAAGASAGCRPARAAPAAVAAGLSAASRRGSLGAQPSRPAACGCGWSLILCTDSRSRRTSRTPRTPHARPMALAPSFRSRDHGTRPARKMRGVRADRRTRLLRFGPSGRALGKAGRTWASGRRCTRPSRRAASDGTRRIGSATAAGVFTNTVFGFILAYTYLALWDERPAPRRLRPGAGADLRVAGAGAARGAGADRAAASRSELMERIRTGDIAIDLYRPADLQLWWLAADLGRAAVPAAGARASCRWWSARWSSSWRCPRTPLTLAGVPGVGGARRGGQFRAPLSGRAVRVLADGRRGLTPMAMLAGHLLLGDAAAAERLPGRARRGRPRCCRGRRCSRCRRTCCSARAPGRGLLAGVRLPGGWARGAAGGRAAGAVGGDAEGGGPGWLTRRRRTGWRAGDGCRRRRLGGAGAARLPADRARCGSAPRWPTGRPS